jgi:hypothetical protein
MPVKTVDIEKLVEWLGSEGAVAGLEASDLTVSDLLELGNSKGLVLDKKSRRRLIAIELVNYRTQQIDKSSDELLRMSEGELKNYFEARMVSATELTKLLEQFGIQARSEDKRNLLEFTAREISDMGMYQRVAKGNPRTVKK